MYCGSCMRDNRAAAALKARGHDFTLLPLYTPIRTDEVDVSDHRVFLGGINVYLDQRFPWFRKLPTWLTRALDAPALLSRVGRFAAKTRAEELGELAVSVLKGEEGPQRRELDVLVDALQLMRPDIVHLSTLLFIGLAGAIRERLGCRVLCTLSGEDIFLDALPEPHRGRAFALIAERAESIDAFMSVTRYYADHSVAHFRLPSDRMHVVPLGIHADGFPPRDEPPDSVFTIGYLARVCPEKGLLQLLESTARLRRAGRNVRVIAGGYIGVGDRPYLEKVQSSPARRELGESFEFRGELSWGGKIDLLRSSHVLCVPTVYREAKGLYVLEALACGVPVCEPRHGSFPELVESTGGGVCYDPADPMDRDARLAQLMDDAALRRQLGEQGRRRVREVFTDERMADDTWKLYERVAAESRA